MEYRWNERREKLFVGRKGTSEGWTKRRIRIAVEKDDE